MRTHQPATAPTLTQFRSAFGIEKVEAEDWRSNPPITPVLNFIERHLAEPLNLARVAEHVGLSPTRLSRLLTTYAPLGLRSYVREIRLDRARRLLSERSRSVKEVGYSVGYSSIPSFVREFTRRYGYPPGRFRRAAIPPKTAPRSNETHGGWPAHVRLARAQVLAATKGPYLARRKTGFTIFFTGLSGAGKSTTATALVAKLQPTTARPFTILDGDFVRKNLSADLGFSRQDRYTNIRRIGFVAREVTKCGGIAICAAIAPYDAARKEARGMVEEVGGFVLIHVATPLDVCEQRDPKGLYAKARAGAIPAFTGISDPYEAPTDADLTIDTSRLTLEEAIATVLGHLTRQGFIGDDPSSSDEVG